MADTKQYRPSRLPPRHSVALCLTVLNEGGGIDELFASIQAQTRQPDQIVVVDGGSTDETVDRITAWQARGKPVELLMQPGANISAGRNAAIAHTEADLIAVTDAGVRLDPNWLEALIQPFEEEPAPDVVSGFFLADTRSAWELALGATTLPSIEEIDPECFLPSSRSVAFTRASWARVGGYPEWLDYCEDLLFDLALRGAGCRFGWAPAAVVYFRPRATPRAFFLQYYRYARGDGKAGLWGRRHAIRYSTYLGLLPALALVRRRPWLFVPLLTAAAAYVRRPYARLLRHVPHLDRSDRAAAIVLVPLVRLIGDVAKMLGYPAGVVWYRRRARLHRAPHLARPGAAAVD